MALPAVLPTLRSDSIELRGFVDADLDLIVEVASDPLIPLITTVPTVPVATEALAYIKRQQARVADQEGYSFAISDVDSGVAVGQIGLWLRDIDHGRASLGYWIAPAARRRGYARQALTTVSEWGLSLSEIHRLELYVEPWNEGSWRTAERAGYRREGLLRSWQAVGEERRDMYMYARLKETVV